MSKLRLHKRRPRPDDFESVSVGQSVHALVSHYHAGYGVVARWFQEIGVSPPKGQAMRGIPENWLELARANTKAGVIKIMKVDGNTVRRWERQTGITCSAYVPVKKPRPSQAKAKVHNFSNIGMAHKTTFHTRPSSIWDDAAATLRAERWITFRCSEGGAANPNGKFWRVGNTVLTPEELLAKAERYRRLVA